MAGLLQHWAFRRAARATLTTMRSEGFEGDSESIADECFKRMVAPADPGVAKDVAFACGCSPMTPGDVNAQTIIENTAPGGFLDIFMAFFQKMIESSFLMTLIKMLFGL